MHRLIAGLSRFRREIYPRHRERYRALADRQSPETLLITCSDSRIVPEWMLDAGPGDVFAVRTAGNIVPPYDLGPTGEAASIEYAVSVLGVREIVVCGHSDCGAMRGLMHPERIRALKAVAGWLRHGANPAGLANGDGRLGESERLTALIEKNVATQVENVVHYPCVAAKIRRGDLAVHGWVYDIARAGFTALDPSTGRFTRLSARSKLRPIAREVDRA